MDLKLNSCFHITTLFTAWSSVFFWAEVLRRSSHIVHNPREFLFYLDLIFRTPVSFENGYYGLGIYRGSYRYVSNVKIRAGSYFIGPPQISQENSTCIGRGVGSDHFRMAAIGNLAPGKYSFASELLIHIELLARQESANSFIWRFWGQI